MRSLFLICIMLVTASAGFSQELKLPGEDGFMDRFKGYDFQGNLTAKVFSDNSGDYFLVDFGRLSSRFARIWFMNQSFRNGEVVNMGFDPGSDEVCFKVPGSKTRQEVDDLFSGLLKDATMKDSTLSDGEKAAWLLENDKYK